MRLKDYLALKPVTVSSARIRDIAHAGGSMYVRFRNGRVYRCTPITREIWQSLIDAPSVGRTFDKYVTHNSNVTATEVQITD